MLLNIILISILVGIVGTGAGSIVGFAVYRRENERRDPHVFMAFASGVIAGLFCFSILPESLRMQPVPYAVMMIVIGAAVALLVTVFCEKTTVSADGQAGDHSRRRALILIAAIAVHNFPEGVALGSELGLYPAQGIVWAILITLHNVPIGMSIGITQSARGSGSKRAVLFAALSGIPLLIGSIIAALADTQTNQYPGALLPLAGGALLAVVLYEIKELLPERPLKRIALAAAIGLALSFAASFL